MKFSPRFLRSILDRRSGLRNFASQSASPETVASRIDRINSRLPKFLRRYTTPLRNAPLTSISAFLILHELTAVVPLFGLAATFHYAEWLPPLVSEGKWVNEGIKKFGNYFKRKGWLGEEVDGAVDTNRGRWWDRGEGSVRIVVEFATAYAITKALLPLRLILSVWATPWFANTAVIPSMRASRRILKRAGFATSSKAIPSPAAGTNAIGGHAIPKR